MRPCLFFLLQYFIYLFFGAIWQTLQPHVVTSYLCSGPQTTSSGRLGKFAEKCTKMTQVTKALTDSSNPGGFNQVQVQKSLGNMFQEFLIWCSICVFVCKLFNHYLTAWVKVIMIEGSRSSLRHIVSQQRFDNMVNVCCHERGRCKSLLPIGLVSQSGPTHT